MSKFCLPVIMLIINSLSVHAQALEEPADTISIYRSLSREAPGCGKVQIYQDPELTRILARHIRMNRVNEDIPRYWIRIFSDSGHGAREGAYDAKGRFMRRFEDIRSEVIYDTPNWKVYVGGFRTKSEALRILQDIKDDFPNAFIVYDRMNFPEI